MSEPSLVTGRRPQAYAQPVQSKPTAATTHPVLPPPSDSPLYQQVAEILLAGYAIHKSAELLAALLKLRVEIVLVALRLARHAHRARPKMSAHGIERNSAAAAIVRTAANEDVFYRAAYVVNASHRMQDRVEAGASVMDAGKAELGNYEAHRRARERRLDAAARVANNAAIFGPVLGWYRNHALDSDLDCIAADGANFIASIPPIIGYPGSVHPNCGCSSGPPHATARTVDESVGFLVRRGRSVANRGKGKARRTA